MNSINNFNEISEEVASQASKIQKEAVNPKHSIWVSASAGTGKTTVLTNRILALLLDGADPRGLLCLTFTKTGASEMKERITEKLMNWQALSDDKLYQEIGKVHEGVITPEILELARNLFNNILDIPQGLKIYTIHAFCQSILQRFPIEAGLSPNFEVIDEVKNQNILEKARLKILINLSSHKNSIEGQALSFLYAHLSADVVEKLLNNLIGHRMKLQNFLESHDSLENAIETIRDFITKDYRRELSTDERYYDFQEYINLITNHEIIINHQNLLTELENAQINGDINKKYFATFKDKFTKWLSDSKEFRSKNIMDLFDLLLSTNRKKLKNYLEKIREENPYLDRLAEHTISKLDPFLSLRQFELTKSLLLVGNIYLEEYRKQKQKIGVLDFDDLISKTVSLMKKDDGVNWVMYKLDTAIQHLLVDEAQDTSPAQWELIKSLSKEFFNDETKTEEGVHKNRTLFVVGDEKQSIYSFQGADRISFTKNKRDLLDLDYNDDHRTVEMQHNFRSAPEILSLVDEVFKPKEFQEAIQGSEVKHYAGRSTNIAYVELLPIYYAPPSIEDSNSNEGRTTGWVSPVHSNENLIPTPKEVLAEDIATKIHELVNSNEILTSKVNPNKTTAPAIQPSDIMILVRSNNHAKFIESALKNKNVPVSGLDKVTLGEHLAIQDLISLANFCLLTSDNLSLAEVLKSPLIEFNDQDLIKIMEYKADIKQSHMTMWQALQNISMSDDLDQDQKSKYKNAVLYLEEVKKLSKNLNPYDLFSYVLSPLGGRKKLVTYLGDQALQPLQMFLDLTLNFDNNGLISLQEFIYDFTSRDIDIKREHTSANEVKIFTVHGSKGMEAPIVFLPRGNFNLEENKDALLWQNNNDQLVPVITTPVKESSSSFQELITKVKDIHMQEELRLLYVALTRAKDRLYVYGHSKKNAIDPELKKKKSKADEKKTWYSLIKSGLDNLSESTGVPLKEDRESIFAKNSNNTQPCYSYGELIHMSEEMQKENDLKTIQDTNTDQENIEDTTLDPIFYEKVVVTETVSRPLSPSNILSSYSTAVSSPLSYTAEENSFTNVFQRGLLIHSLLEYLPNIAEEKRQDVATMWLNQNAILTDDERSNIIKETVDTITTFPQIFTKHGMSEVPVVGNVEVDISIYEKTKKKKLSTHSINAIIDRVVEYDDHVLLVDFKTNRKPPKNMSAVPKSYVLQLKIYKELLKKIYTDKAIKSYILWTEPTVLMEIDIGQYEDLYL